jgi:hypothetical protein
VRGLCNFQQILNLDRQLIVAWYVTNLLLGNAGEGMAEKPCSHAFFYPEHGMCRLEEAWRIRGERRPNTGRRRCQGGRIITARFATSTPSA